MLPKEVFAPILEFPANPQECEGLLQGADVGRAIFISYRRDDSEGEAGRLFDDLTGAFGTDCVFMDVAGISPGADFRKAIEDNVGSCGVLLAIIGPRWSSVTDAAGKRRLEDPNDFVALEIASALKREIPVIPVLVHEAKMPPADELPEILQDLAYRNSVELTHTRWNSDCQLLIEALRAYVKHAASDAGDPVHATVPVQLPARRPNPGTVPVVAARPKAPFILGIVCATLLLAIVVIYLVARPRHSREPMDEVASSPSSLAPPSAQKSVTAPPPTASGGGETSPMAAASATSVQGAPDGIVGKWVLPQQMGGETLNAVEITGTGNDLRMQAWGACRQSLCDWGTQPLKVVGGETTSTFAIPALPNGWERIAVVRLRPHAGKLQVTIQNTYTKGATIRHSQARRIFVRKG